MTRVPEADVPSAASSSLLLFLMSAAVASTRKWTRWLRADLLATDLEKNNTRCAPREHAAGFFCSHSDAEFQILLAELRYPRLGIGGMRDP